MTARASCGIEVRPSGAALGADIEGVDLRSALSDAQVAAIAAAWHEHLVLRFRGQRLSDAELIAFSQRLGRLDKAPARSDAAPRTDPEAEYVLFISNVKRDGVPIGELGDAEAFWHQDMTYVDRPPVGAALYAVELPPSGGDTQFCNLRAAYEALPAELQSRIEGLTCIHDATYTSSGAPRRGYTPTTDPRHAVGPAHPLVQVHPRTGRRHLYLGRRGYAYIPGLRLDESEALLDTLWSHARRAEFTWTQVWALGDLVLWDNRCTMHRRDAFDPASRRILHRTQIATDFPVAVAA